jgi:hypothetical protein
MKTYRAEFTGREKNAIGIFYPITDEVKGENEEQAGLNLYDKWEHVHGLKLTQIDQVDIKVKSEMYGVTDCVVNVEQYKEGKRIFPCGDGTDHKLTDKNIKEVEKLIKQWGL